MALVVIFGGQNLIPSGSIRQFEDEDSKKRGKL